MREEEQVHRPRRVEVGQVRERQAAVHALHRLRGRRSARARSGRPRAPSGARARSRTAARRSPAPTARAARAAPIRGSPGPSGRPPRRGRPTRRRPRAPAPRRRPEHRERGPARHVAEAPVAELVRDDPAQLRHRGESSQQRVVDARAASSGRARRRTRCACVVRRLASATSIVRTGTPARSDSSAQVAGELRVRAAAEAVEEPLEQQRREQAQHQRQHGRARAPPTSRPPGRPGPRRPDEQRRARGRVSTAPRTSPFATSQASAGSDCVENPQRRSQTQPRHAESGSRTSVETASTSAVSSSVRAHHGPAGRVPEPVAGRPEGEQQRARAAATTSRRGAPDRAAGGSGAPARSRPPQTNPKLSRRSR